MGSVGKDIATASRHLGNLVSAYKIGGFKLVATAIGNNFLKLQFLKFVWFRIFLAVFPLEIWFRGQFHLLIVLDTAQMGWWCSQCLHYIAPTWLHHNGTGMPPRMCSCYHREQCQPLFASSCCSCWSWPFVPIGSKNKKKS